MKLSKKDRNTLNSILVNLTEGVNFIMEKETAIMRETHGTDNSVFTSKMSSNIYHSINKEIGSKLCYLLTAKSQLSRELFPQENGE